MINLNQSPAATVLLTMNLIGYEKSDIVKLEIRVNEEPVDAFSCLVHRSKAEGKGKGHL